MVNFPSALLVECTWFKGAEEAAKQNEGGCSAGLLWPHRPLLLTPRTLPSAGKEAHGELYQGADPAGNHSY